MDFHWQVQEAKQRFSDVLRRAHSDGPQFVTKHGTEVAVIVDIAEYRRLTGETMDLKAYLLSMPKTDDDEDLVLERSRELPREIDFSDES